VNPILYGFEYEYDAASNRTRKEDLVSGEVTTYTPDALNLIANEVSSVGPTTTSYEYDQAQRMRTRYSPTLATYFVHDQRSLPTRLEFAVSAGFPNTTHEFGYTGAGERALMIGGQGGTTATYLAYDGSRLLTERDEFFTYGKYRWACPPGLIEVVDQEAEVTNTPVMDERGSVEVLGGVAGRAIYDRFGVEFVNTIASTTRARFVSPAFVSNRPWRGARCWRSGRQEFIRTP
jgi:hypothetical protein